MAGGNGGQKSESPIVEPSDMLGAPAVHVAATDVDKLKVMSSAFDYVGSLTATGAGVLSTDSRAENPGGIARQDGTGRVVRVLKGAWPLFLAGLPALVTLIALSLRLFPWLEPTPPPEVRSVTITELALGERNREFEDGVIANVVFFEVEAVGYDAQEDDDDIAVDWLVFDAGTRQRLEESLIPEHWGEIVFGTRSDRIMGEIVVPPPVDHVGCVFVRVQLQPFAATSEQEATSPAGIVPISSSGEQWVLDVADTAPFDPFDPKNPDCPDEQMPLLAAV
jgi:hypothetical protein